MEDDTRLPDPARLREFPLDVYRVRPGTTVYLKTLTDQYGGLFGHHKKPRTYYCPGDECSCEHRKVPRVWYGYSACMRYDRDAKLWLPVVLQISEALEHCLRGVYRRGQVWEVSRAEPSKAKPFPPILGRKVEDLKPAQVPEQFPILPVLHRVFRVKNIELHHGNPVPPPVRVVIADQAPPAAEVPTRPQTIPEHVRQRLRGYSGNVGAMPSDNGQHGRDGG